MKKSAVKNAGNFPAQISVIRIFMAGLKGQDEIVPKAMTLLNTLKLAVQYGCFIALCIGCDKAIFIARFAKSSFIKANHRVVLSVMDSISHGLIALYAWLLVAEFNINAKCVASALLCAAIACLVDVDHFIAAGSWKLKDALHLKSRPPFHCTSILLPHFLAICIGLTTKGISLLQDNLFTNVLLVSFTAVITHHLRDGLRRGLWFWPVGATSPLPLHIYLLLIISLPVFLSRIRKQVDCTNNVPLVDVV